MEIDDWPAEDDRDWIVFSRVPGLLPGSWRACLVCRRTREAVHALVQGGRLIIYDRDGGQRLPTAGQFGAAARADLVR